MESVQATVRLFVSLRNKQRHSQLQISPNELNFLSITLTILFFICRSIKCALGLGIGIVPSRPAKDVFNDTSTLSGQTFALPDLSLSMPLRLSTHDSHTFANTINCHVDALRSVSISNAQICLYLAAISEPAMLLLLAKRGCPVRPLGAVNVRNRFEILNVDACRALLGNEHESEQINPKRLSVSARFPRSARRVRRGIEADVEICIMTNTGPNMGVHASLRATAENEPQHTAIFRQEFTLLQFMKFRDRGSVSATTQRSEVSSRDRPTNSSLVGNQFFLALPMSVNAPHDWAKLCKDYNPIHFSSILAKSLGQPGQLAHGNHAVALCIHAMSTVVNENAQASTGDHVTVQEMDDLQRLVKDGMESSTLGQKPWRMEVRFRRPVVLPAKIGAKLSGSNSFGVLDTRSGKTCIEVNIGSAS